MELYRSNDCLVLSAAKLAKEAHKGQVRDYTKRPYVEHPGRVAMQLALANQGPVVVAAGWLHDVLEDTPVPASVIAHRTSIPVLALVEELTNPSKKRPDLPRAERKAMDCEHLAGVSQAAKLIKLFDCLDNLRDMSGASKEFKAKYAQESSSLIWAMTINDAALKLTIEHHAPGLTSELYNAINRLEKESA